MTRALVLNAGSSWAAYQIGALGWVARKEPSFDLVAGTGIGAMNGAFVACGQLEALEESWSRIRVIDLVRPALRRPWLGPLVGTPQRRLIASHVSEEALRSRGTTLLVSTLDLQAGEERILEYPGCNIPIVDGLMAAVATPGAVAPYEAAGHQLGEGTLVDSFLLRDVMRRGPAEVVAIAAAPPPVSAPCRYRTWRAVAERALALNMGHDVVAALEDARMQVAVASARERAHDGLTALVDGQDLDPDLAETLRERIAAVYDGSPPTLVQAITPSRELGYPLWSFRRRALSEAMALGRQDARVALEEASG